MLHGTKPQFMEVGEPHFEGKPCAIVLIYALDKSHFARVDYSW